MRTLTEQKLNEKNINQCSNWTIIQTLKACTERRDAQRGLKIHNLISSRLKYDPYVLPSLIHFYSKFIGMRTCRICTLST